VPDLAAEFGVAEVTVRRDLAELEERGKLTRVHGGALPRDRLAYEYSFRDKMEQRHPAKRVIGEAAAGLLGPLGAVFLDTGTTALEVARAIKRGRCPMPAAIVTVNLRVAMEFVGVEGTRVYVPGGQVAERSPDVFGPLTERNLRELAIGTAFLGCDAVDPQRGFFTTSLFSVAIAQIVLERAQEAYFLADSAKMGYRAAWLMAEVKGPTGIVTDSGIKEGTLEGLRGAGMKVVVAELPPGETCAGLPLMPVLWEKDEVGGRHR